MIKGLSQRYENECKLLAHLAMKQLNLSKNSIKEDFENMTIQDIFFGLKDEVDEVEAELYDNNFDLKKSINHQRLIEEASDVASFCVGIIAWVNRQRELQTEDGA